MAQALPPNQVWSVAYQRVLLKRWSEPYQRQYWDHYVEGQWIFFSWDPIEPADPFHTRTDSAHNAGPANSRLGRTVLATWDGSQNTPHFETLDHSFYVRPKSFFTLGKVFAVLFTEPAGSTVTSYNDAITYVRFGEMVHTQVRRFIVVRQKREFCFAVPIFSYNHQATKKPGVVPDEHAIAYSYGFQPTLLDGEEALSKEPICVVMSNDVPPLTIDSRIFFGIHHPIQYNVKVKELGYVVQECLVNLKGYWAMENHAGTNQDAAVTAEGDEEEG